MTRPFGHFLFAGTPRNSQYPDTALERRPGSRPHSTSRNERKAPVHEENLPARREKSEDRGEPDHDPRLSRSRSRQRLGALFHPRDANETLAADGPAVKVSGFYPRRPPPSSEKARENGLPGSGRGASRRPRPTLPAEEAGRWVDIGRIELRLGRIFCLGYVRSARSTTMALCGRLHNGVTPS